MIVFPKNAQEFQALAGFLIFYAGVTPSADLRCIGWVSEKKLVCVVGFNAFLGKVAQAHVAYAPDWHFTPRQLLREAFRYAFDTAKVEMLLGVVNSKNERAMKMDLHLGFREIHRLPGMHQDDGDIVMLAMKKDECRYLDEPDSTLVAAAGRA